MMEVLNLIIEILLTEWGLKVKLKLELLEENQHQDLERCPRKTFRTYLWANLLVNGKNQK